MNAEEIIRYLARSHGVSEETVKAEMQAAIHLAYQAPPDDLTAARQKLVPHRGKEPTIQELLDYAVNRYQELKNPESGLVRKRGKKI